MRQSLLAVSFLGLLVLMGLSQSCGEREADIRPVVVVGIDGAEWRVIKDLWEQDRLPNIKALADRGSSAILRTFSTMSPVIWTTIATGVKPDRHGITGFVVATESGDIPVSSELRRVPAIWNMVSVAQRRVAVLGWWATWPAEEVEGIVLSDRALFDVERGLYPPDRKDDLSAWKRMSKQGGVGFRGGTIAQRRDRLVAVAAPILVNEGFDLTLVYFRSVDVVSHRNWKYYEPQKFENVDGRDRKRKRIPGSYEAVDKAIGRLVDTAGPEVNFFVISDHGFHAKESEETEIGVDFDRVLEQLGFLEYGDGGVDFARTRVYSYASAKQTGRKKVRFSLRDREPEGSLLASETSNVRQSLETALATVSYENGESVFEVRDASEKEARNGADFVVEVLTEFATPKMKIDGTIFEKGIDYFARISGTHSWDTHGIFIAAGQDIRRGVDLHSISVKDITPTLLYGMGLPVAEDFDGAARVGLFTQRFRKRHPMTEIASWGTREGQGVVASDIDEQLVEELRALGYLD